MYALHYHFVFIPKYRKPVLRGDVGLHFATHDSFPGCKRSTNRHWLTAYQPREQPAVASGRCLLTEGLRPASWSQLVDEAVRVSSEAGEDVLQIG